MGDREVEAQISRHVDGEPVVQHFIHAELSHAGPGEKMS
jgi:hypothetical protein